MLAIDQREALRAMIGDLRGRDVSDGEVTHFKVAAARALTPHASAVLVDHQFGWDAVLDEKAIDPGCALITAADRFIPGPGEFVADAVIDEDVDPAVVREQGAVAMKLLVIWRPDGDPAARKAMVESFVARCRDHGLASIIEPVSRAPRAGGPYDVDAGIIAAARELGALGADIYKTEVPTHGSGPDDEILTRSRELDDAVDGHWVVLSSGVRAERFPHAVELACRAGASGFLAGRAVWASVVGSDDLDADLHRVAVPALRRLTRVVDEAVSR
ncbi:aldolase [Phytoactinopolyspora alkaliphila]|uniref:Aldolase n=1 Tax=Phytoactinopolyspora alkaliphila TaxID=1783498 RepID=A0A6N9YMK7_9ACTN|nr:aldolase [Phytoactinopolyspora alkaliphila]NED96089.1 aldolase [Phytoactinopolyspora alkaliphila]